MTEEKAREILEEVLKEKEAKQEIIQRGMTPPTHNVMVLLQKLQILQRI